jgi:hypothetical protein
VAPPNKTVLLLGNGLVAKLGVRSAPKAGRLTELADRHVPYARPAPGTPASPWMTLMQWRQPELPG